MEGHKADSMGREAAAWTQTKPASGQETINFIQAWGKQQAPSSGRKDSRPGEGLAQPREGAGEELNLGGPRVQGEPCLESSPTTAPSPPQAGQPLALFMWLLKVQTLLCYATILSSFREKLSNTVLLLFFFVLFFSSLSYQKVAKIT